MFIEKENVWGKQKKEHRFYNLPQLFLNLIPTIY